MDSVFSHFKSSRGFGLVEIMIALLVGMLALLVVMQVYSVSEGFKRTTTSGSDAQTNGATALYFIERDVRMAGYGIATKESDGALAICTNVKAYNANRLPSASKLFDFGSAALYPMVINPAGIPVGDANTDIIQMSYSGSFGMVGEGNTFTALADNSYLLNPRVGFRLGDLVLAVQSGRDCTIAEVTSLPSGSQCDEADNASQSAWVKHGTAAYKTVYPIASPCGTVTPAWNDSANPPLDVTFTAGKLYNLGPPGGFVSRVYAVRGGRLTVCDMTAYDCTDATEATNANNQVATVYWATVAEGIVSLQAQYGHAADDSGAVSTWSKTTPTTFVGWTRMLASRIAVVSKSGQYEKNDGTDGAPVFASSLPNWPDGTSMNSTLSTALNTGDNAHYRFKTFLSVIPMRNMVWAGGA